MERSLKGSFFIMENYNFDKGIDRRNTDSVKWDMNDHFFGKKDVLSMWVADMDFEAPPEVINALQNRAKHGAYGYTKRPDSLIQAVVDWERNRHGWQIEKEWLVFTPGIVPAINFFVDCFTEKGEGIIIQTPVYHPFIEACEWNERKLVNNQLILKDNGYEVNYELLEKQATDPAVKMMVISNPHNPVGKVFSETELHRIGDICSRNNVLLISDEIHQDIVYTGYRHICTATLSDEIAKNTVTCIAPSKTFNIAGLQLSAVVISDPETRDKFSRYILTKGLYGSNIFGITAGEAAYKYGQPWLNSLLQYLEGNIDFMENFFKKSLPVVKMHRPQATYLAWLDFRELGLTQEELVRRMIHEAGLGLNDGSSFGPGGEGFMRLNFACPRSTLEEGLNRMKKIV